MARSLHQKLLQAVYGTGTLGKTLRDEVLAECLQIITTNDSCKVALGSASVADALDYADTLFIVDWKNLVRKSRGMADFRHKLTLLCINACNVWRRRSYGPLGLPMGGYVGVDFPDNVGSY